MDNLGVHFKRVRLEKNLTQKQVADGLGVSESQYQQWEYGKRVPVSTTLIALADYLGVSIDYLVGRTDNPAANR